MHPETRSNINPYAAPADAEPAGESVAWHHDLELAGNQLRCRSGLWLPEICVVTGRKQNLVAIPVQVRALRNSRLWVRRLGIFFLVAVPLGAILAMSGTAPVPRTPAAMAAGVPFSAVLPAFVFMGSLLLGLVLFLAGGRRGVNCAVQIHVEQQRLVWIRRFANLLAPLMLLISGLVFTALSYRSLASVLVCLLLVPLSLLSLWLQRGMRLRAVVDENNGFVLRGFSRAFLKQLGDLQNSEKTK